MIAGDRVIFNDLISGREPHSGQTATIAFAHDDGCDIYFADGQHTWAYADELSAA